MIVVTGENILGRAGGSQVLHWCGISKPERCLALQSGTRGNWSIKGLCDWRNRHSMGNSGWRGYMCKAPKAAKVLDHWMVLSRWRRVLVFLLPAVWQQQEHMVAPSPLHSVEMKAAWEKPRSGYYCGRTEFIHPSLLWDTGGKCCSSLRNIFAPDFAHLLFLHVILVDDPLGIIKKTNWSIPQVWFR